MAIYDFETHARKGSMQMQGRSLANPTLVQLPVFRGGDGDCAGTAGRARWSLAAVMSTFLSLFLACADPVWSQTSSPTGGPRIVLIQPRETAEDKTSSAKLRLRAELRAAGFEVIEKVASKQDARKAVEEATSMHGAMAAIYFVEGGDRAAVDVWIHDRVTQKTLVKRVELAPGQSTGRLFAIRVVDLLRASLLELDRLSPPIGRPSVAKEKTLVPKVVQRLIASESPQQWAASLGASAALYAHAGLGFGPELTLSYRGAMPWVVGLDVLGPLLGAQVSSASGSASLVQVLGTLEMGYRLSSEQWPLSLTPHIGAGLMYLGVNGESEPPFQARRTDGSSPVGVVGLRTTWAIQDSTELAFQIAVFRAWRPFAIEIAGQREARVAAPGSVVGLRLEQGF